MVVVLDTNIVVDYLRNHRDTVAQVEQYSEICLPVTVCGELLFGAAISNNTARHQEKVTDFISRTKVLIVDMEVVEQYVEIRKHLQAKGRPIPENDIWIAASAHAHGLRLITRDQHFSNVEFLDLQLWK